MRSCKVVKNIAELNSVITVISDTEYRSGYVIELTMDGIAIYKYSEEGKLFCSLIAPKVKNVYQLLSETKKTTEGNPLYIDEEAANYFLLEWSN